MKKINIFLSIGEKDLKDDQYAISNFIRDLNDKYEDSNIYFSLITDENIRNIQEDIKNSELFLILFENQVDSDSLYKFNIAYENFIKDKTPKISTYIKKSNEPPDKSMLKFMKHLDEELGHYYSNYDSIDTIKLNIILQLKSLGLTSGEIITKDGKIFIGEKELLKLDNIPMFFNNKQLQSLKQEYQTISENYWNLKEKVRENENDNTLFEEYVKAKNKRDNIQQMIFDLESNIIDLESTFVDISLNGKLSKRQIYAKKCLDEGNIEEAKIALDFEEIKKDGNRYLHLQSKNRNTMKIILEDLLERIEVLKADNQNNAEKIQETYEEAIKIEKEIGENRNILYSYAEYLYSQNKFSKAMEYAETYLYYLKTERIEDDKIINLLDKIKKGLTK